MAQNRNPSPAASRQEVHARTHRGEIVLNPEAIEGFLEREDLAPPHPEFGGREVEVEVRTASRSENPPNGALWLTALDGHVSICADPVEVLRVLHEGGLLDELRERGELPFL